MPFWMLGALKFNLEQLIFSYTGDFECDPRLTCFLHFNGFESGPSSLEIGAAPQMKQIWKHLRLPQKWSIIGQTIPIGQKSPTLGSSRKKVQTEHISDAFGDINSK
ncbi:hypothetical protein CEXT_800741 [Caerostris extrusa]|uniref:Uncharacterized protein n=1 Tax=Caerostris extrusa TaxID=172846 RepID=A0AAV4PRZ6_CAEEX|nr:hypothetical protein CEXT_800741 [Caerostris extrusa]